MPRDTGFPRADVENEFLRMRRRQVLARLAHKLSREPDDVNLVLPYSEVVAALGYESERAAGLKTIKLVNIVGSVDERRDFDRRFRPTSARVRERWEQLALAQRRGAPMPPIDVYKLGDLYFVKDGHHRVSIALARGETTIDAYVTEVRTTLPAKDIRTPRPLFKSYERMFLAGCHCHPRCAPRSRSPTPGRTPSLARTWRPGASATSSTSGGRVTGRRSPAAGSPTSTRRS
jgi:hypothetical protein